MTSPDERVELVRDGFRAYNARDTGALLRIFDPGIEIYNNEGLMNSGTYRGHEGYLQWVRQWEEAWEDFQNTPEEVEAVGERHAVARIRASGRGRGSGVEVKREIGYVYEPGKRGCVYLALYSSFEEARRVACEREGIADDG